MQFGRNSSLQYHLLPLCKALWFCGSKKYKQSPEQSINKRKQQAKGNFICFPASGPLSINEQKRLWWRVGMMFGNCYPCHHFPKGLFFWTAELIGSCFWLSGAILVMFWLVGLGLVWPAKTPTVHAANIPRWNWTASLSSVASWLFCYCPWCHSCCCCWFGMT